MRRRREFQADMEFINCTVANGLSGVREVVHLLSTQDLVPVLSHGDRDGKMIPVDDVDAYVTEMMVYWPDWSFDQHFGRYEYARGLLRMTAVGFEELLMSADFRLVTPEYLWFSVGGLVDFQFKDQSALVEPWADRLRSVALALWPILAPDYGCVDESWAEHISSMRQAVRQQFPRTIGWINFFGPAYIEKYGRDFLMELPGYYVQELDNTGIVHQLCPSILSQDRSQEAALRQQVIEYCADHGHRVFCRAPYRL